MSKQRKTRIAILASAMLAIFMFTGAAAGGCNDHPLGPPIPGNDDPDWVKDWHQDQEMDLADVNVGLPAWPAVLVPGYNEVEFKWTVWGTADDGLPHTVSIPGAMTISAYGIDGVVVHYSAAEKAFLPGPYFSPSIWTGGTLSYKTLTSVSIARIDAKMDLQLERGMYVYCAAFLNGQKVDEYEHHQTTEPVWGSWEPTPCSVSVNFPL